MSSARDILTLLNESLFSLDDSIELILGNYGIKKLPTPVPNLPSNMQNATGFLTEDNSILVIDEYNGRYSIGVVNKRLGIITGRPTGYDSLDEFIEYLPKWLSNRGFIKQEDE
jgi:hypothetical protein